MPLTARSRTLSGGPASRGPLIATFAVNRPSQNRSSGAELGQAAGRWTVSEAGEAAGFEALAATTRLAAPDNRPPGWSQLEAVGGGEYSSTVMPWFGEIHNPQGIGGAVVALSATTRLSLRTYTGQSPREIRLFGADTPAVAGQTFRLYAVIS